MMKLKNDLQLAVLYILALAVIACGLFGIYQTIQLLKADNQIATQQSTITNQKLAIDGLASEVAYLGNEVDSLVKQSELTAALNAEYERQAAAIADTGIEWQAKSTKLQVSENENTRTWAAAALPDDALRMLSEASRSQNSDGQATDLHSAATEHGQLRLSVTSI
jgi:hypothetical protein